MRSTVAKTASPCCWRTVSPSTRPTRRISSRSARSRSGSSRIFIVRPVQSLRVGPSPWMLGLARSAPDGRGEDALNPAVPSFWTPAAWNRARKLACRLGPRTSACMPFDLQGSASRRGRSTGRRRDGAWLRARSRVTGQKMQAGRGLRVGPASSKSTIGVGKSADFGRDRHRAIAHGAELRQPARLEPRRHQHGVGAGLDQVRQILVIADDASDLSAMGVGQAPQTLLQLGIAGTEHRKLRAARDQRRDRIGQEVEPLLPGHPADHGEQQRVGICRKAEPLLQRRLVRRARRATTSGRNATRSGSRSPDSRRRCRSRCGCRSTRRARARSNPSRPQPSAAVWISCA